MATGDSRVRVDMTTSGATQRATRSIVNRLRAGTFPEADRRALLDALNAVPRADLEVAVRQWDETAKHYVRVRDRAERAERERDSERDRADGWMGNCALQPCLQDPYNPCEPGWLDGDLNGDEVCPPCWARLSLRDDTGTCVGCGNMTNGWFADGDKGPGWYCGWCPPVPGKPGIALSADADADAEPEPWEHLRVPYEGDTATAGELAVATEHPDGTCAFCDQRRDADAEPSRAEGDEGTHYMDDGCPGGHRLFEGDKVGEHVWECGCIDDVEADGSHTRAVNCDRHMPPADDGRSRVVDALDKEMPAASRQECEDAADRLLASGVVRFRGGSEGADGRQRAVDAILATLPDLFSEDAKAAIDAALGSGGVVRAEGDDGYCRAVQAAIRRLVDRRESGGRDRLDAVERAMLHADAACAVDAALASGGVVTREQLEHADRIEAETASERDRAEARVRKLEAALREIADDGAGHGLHPLTRCAVCRARAALEGADRA